MADPVDIAKVFMSGRSQAVRLPKAYRFETAEVSVQRIGDAVVLRPVPAARMSNSRRQRAWVADLMAAVEAFDGMPETIDRDPTPVREAPALDGL